MIGHPMSLCQARRPALIVAVSTTALLLAACGSSTPAKPVTSSTSATAQASGTSAPATPPPPPAPPAPPKVKTQGKVNSVTGSTLALSAKKGPTTVNITPTTKIILIAPAQLSDVSIGACVDVKQAAAAAGAPPTPAKSITIIAGASVKCAQSSDDKGVSGAVTAVNGPTVLVASTPGAPASVPTDKKTKYLKQAPATALVITAGVCLSASGTVDPTGALQATAATVGPPPKAACPGS
jgi:hypothetical protein